MKSRPDPGDRLDVEALLAELPERWRAIVEAVDLDDVPADNVARAFGIGRTRSALMKPSAKRRPK